MNNENFEVNKSDAKTEFGKDQWHSVITTPTFIRGKITSHTRLPQINKNKLKRAVIRTTRTYSITNKPRNHPSIV